jgi:methylthioribose-1-phosphate isomerase
MVNFFTEKTVRWDEGTVVLIDQMRLPNKLAYIKCQNHLEVANAIRRMNIRGAPAIGVAAAMGLALAARTSKAKSKQQLISELEASSRDLLETRPTAANISWGVNRILRKARGSADDLNSMRKDIVDEAKQMGEEDVKNNMEMGRNGSVLLEDGDTVLTHCKWF